MTFKLELHNHKIIKEAFESISRIVDEVTLICDSEGIHLSALDRSHITFCNMELSQSLFDEYQCDVPEKINIDCHQFMTVLKKCKTTDTLQLTIDEGNLIIIFKGDATRKFNLRLIDLEYEPATPPNISHPVKINIPSQLLRDAIEDMLIFKENLMFQIDQDYFKISTTGEFGDANIKYLHGENINTTATSTFSIPKLQDILKSSKFSNEAELHLGDDMPLKLTLKLNTGDGELRYLLAPRIELDD